MIINILGIPTPLQRHRSFIRCGKVHQYDSQVKEKLSFQKKIRNEIFLSDHPMITELLSKEYYDITLLFGMPYPKSKKRKNMPLLCDIPHNVKPDLDNLIKFVLDCGNGILWHDDKKITRITSRKMYVEEPKTLISIE